MFSKIITSFEHHLERMLNTYQLSRLSPATREQLRRTQESEASYQTFINT